MANLSPSKILTKKLECNFSSYFFLRCPMPREDDWSNKKWGVPGYFGRGMLKYGLLGPLKKFEVIRGLSQPAVGARLAVCAHSLAFETFQIWGSFSVSVE